LTRRRFVAGVGLRRTKSVAVPAREAGIVGQITFPTSEPDKTLGPLSDQLRDGRARILLAFEHGKEPRST